MIPAWYFCQSIDADPVKTSAFLAILETLENETSDAHLIDLACRELQRTVIWMQIYALPYVLDARQRNPRATDRSAVKDVLSGLLAVLPDAEVAHRFRLILSYGNSQLAGERTNLFNTAAETALHLVASRTASSLPYFDLREFLPVTLLLASLADDLRWNASAAAQLTTALANGKLPYVSELLQEALANQYGRLPLILAGRIALRLPEQFPALELLNRLRDRKMPVDAPDLMQLRAQCVLAEQVRSADGDFLSAVPHYLDKAIGLDELRERPLTVDDSLLVHWQIAMWSAALQEAIERDCVGKYADLLGPYWRPLRPAAARSIQVRGASQDGVRWAAMLAALAQLPGGRQIHRPYVRDQRYANRCQVEGEVHAVTSPWLILNRENLTYRRKVGRPLRYLSANSLPALTRLAAASIMAVSILRHSGMSSETRKAFAAFVVHCRDVLFTTYTGTPLTHTSDYDESGQLRNIPNDLNNDVVSFIGMGRHAARQVDLAGKATWPSIAPWDFLQLAEDGAIDHLDAPSQFLPLMLPAACAEWIEDAYNAAIADSPQQRWLPYVLPWYRKNNSYSSRELLPGTRTTMALVVRFLHPNEDLTPARDFGLDWRGIKGDRTDIYPRSLFFPLGDVSTDSCVVWSDGWDAVDNLEENQAERQSVVEKQTGLKMALAIQRVGAICAGTQIDLTLRARWERDLLHSLAQVRKLSNMDRFVRLRLLELLTSPALEKPVDGVYLQELIAFLLLEFGSVYDLVQLLDTHIFPIDEDGTLRPAKDENHRNLRKTLLRAMFYEVRRFTEESESSLAARDPRYLLRNEAKYKAMDVGLTRIALGESINGPDPEGLAQELRALEDHHLQHRTNFTMRHNEVAYGNGAPGVSIARTAPAPSQSNRDVAAAVVNRNTSTVKTFFTELAPINTSIINLFDLDPLALGKWLAEYRNGFCTLIGVVVAVETGERPVVVFNIGWTKYLQWHPEHANELSAYAPGDQGFVIVRKAGGNLEFDRVQKRRLPVVAPTSLLKVEISEHLQSNPQHSPLKIAHAEGITIPLERFDTPYTDWFPDISRAVAVERRPAMMAYAEQSNSGNITPVDRNLTNLIAAVIKDAGEPQPTLTLIGKQLMTDGQSGWRFSWQPGMNFLLLEDQFDENSRRLLENITNEHSDPCGLLVTIEPVFSGSRVLLHLADTSVGEHVHPNLAVPFDTRNIEWKSALSPDDHYIARRTESDLVVDIGSRWAKLGFPHQVAIQLYPEFTGDLVDIAISAWDQQAWRTGVVNATVADRFEATLNARDGSLSQWLHLKQGDRIRLDRTAGSVQAQYDRIPCITQHQLRVYVDAESLTMIPYPEQWRIYLERSGRVAEVCNRANWDRVWSQPVVHLVPPEQFADRVRVEGVLIAVPQQSERNKAARICTVLWYLGDEEVRQDIEVENLQDIKREVGWKVVGTLHHGQWHIEFYSRWLTLRALWNIRSEPAPPLGEYALIGRIQRDGIPMDLLESTGAASGTLVEVPHQPEIPVFATLHGATADDNHSRNNQVFVRQTFRNGQGGIEQRATLAVGHRIVTGDVRTFVDVGGAMLSDVEIQVAPAMQRADDDLRSVRRWFSLRRRTLDEEPLKRDVEVWQERLQRYLDHSPPAPLPAVADRHRGSVRLNTMRVPNPNGETWTAVVPTIDDPYVDDIAYIDDALVCLGETAEGSIVASFRAVPSETLESWFARVGAPGELVSLREPLAYAGPEPSKAAPDGTILEPMHRFEWGYGKTLVVPESQLRFHGKPFSQNAGLILFYGDMVTHVTIKYVHPDAAVDSNGTGKYVLDVRNIRNSRARGIYEHQQRYRVVHRLHLGISRDDIQVTLVEGFNDSPDSDSDLKSLGRVGAVLDTSSTERLLKRAQEIGQIGPNSPTASTVVLGRLNTHTYEASCGRDVEFRHVRFSFEAKPGEHLPSEALLHNNDRVFLRVKGTRELHNDLGLILTAPDDIDRNDRGPDMAQVLLLRRDYSIQEDRLRQVLDQMEPGHEGRIILASVTRVGQRQNARAFLLERFRDRTVPLLPPRGISALGSRDAAPLAAIINADKNEVNLELSPGVFVRLDESHLAIPTNLADLVAGTIVRVNRDQRANRDRGLVRFNLTRAVPGQRAYLSRNARLAVALPLNPLMRRNVLEGSVDGRRPTDTQFWMSPRFSVGGLPDVLATPGTPGPRDDSWHAPNPNQFTQWMRRPHPRIAQVALDQGGQPRLAPASDDALIGSLDPGNSVEHPKVRLSTRGADVEIERAIPWRVLSFADEPSTYIAKRARAVTWRYHDTQTGSWTDTYQIEPHTVELGSCASGPLFFDGSQSDPRLRFQPEKLRAFGYPVDELVAQLEKKNSTRWFTVVAVSDRGGLWLEIAPGYIAELPAPIAISMLPGRRRIELEDLWWTAFAAGDKVSLELENDATRIRRIILSRWRSGPRGSFGRYGAMLPIIGFDPEHGALQLGAGDYTLTIPATNLPPAGDRPVLLQPDNSIQIAEDFRPIRGNVVLLGEENARIFVHGAPGLTPLPDPTNPELWKPDPLRDLIVLQNGTSPNPIGIAALIQASGGALPVTTESVDRDRLYYSRALQHTPLNAPTKSEARVVGVLDGQNVLLRCGPHLFRSRLSTIVSGCPASVAAEVVQHLRTTQEPIWFRMTDTGKLEFGIQHDQGRELSVETVQVVESQTANNGRTQMGIVCRSIDSRRLYWLPARFAAWARLSADQLRAVFEGDQPPFNVRIVEHLNRESKQVSKIDVREVRQELNYLRVGRQLSIRTIRLISTSEQGISRWLATTLSTGLALICETYGDQLEPGDIRAVEVIRHSSGDSPEIVVVPAGKKRFYLDLPLSVLKSGDGLVNFDGEAPQSEAADPILETVQSSEQVSESALQALPVELLEQMLLNVSLKETRNTNDVTNKVLIARTWVHQQVHQSEMSVVAGLTAIVMLATVAGDYRRISQPDTGEDFAATGKDCDREARDLLAAIGVRLIRSLHVDSVRNQWLGGALNVDAFGSVARRLEPLQKYLTEPADKDGIELMRQFHYAMRMRSGALAYAGLQRISDSLAAAIGELEDVSSLIEPEPLHRIARMGLSVSSPASPDHLHPLQVKMIQQFIGNALADGWDVRVMNEVPFFGNKEIDTAAV